MHLVRVEQMSDEELEELENEFRRLREENCDPSPEATGQSDSSEARRRLSTSSARNRP